LVGIEFLKRVIYYGTVGMFMLSAAVRGKKYDMGTSKYGGIF
jgi:hypothetical protein